jgi:predicted O-methyltransferase YrrM
MIALGCLLGGVASPMPGPDDPLHYLEFGCGRGYGAMVLAASNPNWCVTAIDCTLNDNGQARLRDVLDRCRHVKLRILRAAGVF